MLKIGVLKIVVFILLHVELISWVSYLFATETLSHRDFYEDFLGGTPGTPFGLGVTLWLGETVVKYPYGNEIIAPFHSLSH